MNYTIVKTVEEIDEFDFSNYAREQETNQIYSYISQLGHVELITTPFYANWGAKELNSIMKYLKDLTMSGGLVIIGYVDNDVKTFCAVDYKSLYKDKYQQLVYFHVDKHYRNQGFGKKMQAIMNEELMKKGTKYIYAKSNPDLHTITAYQAMGFSFDEEPDMSHLEDETKDIILVYNL